MSNLNLLSPQYYREVWHYNDANTELIRRSVDEYNWQKAFLNKNVKLKVNIFNETILNIAWIKITTFFKRPVSIIL